MREVMHQLLLFVALVISSACAGSPESVSSEPADRPEAPAAERPGTYRCIVREARQLTDYGGLADLPALLKAQTVNKTFDVDQISGIIDGAVGNNWSFESQRVLFTPPGNPFYVISTTRGPNRNVDLLTIREWAAAPDKPFILAQSSYVFSGTCRKG